MSFYRGLFIILLFPELSLPITKYFEIKQEKPQGALTPPLFSLPLGSKIYYGQVKVGDLSYLLRACDDNINQDTTCLITLF